MTGPVWHDGDIDLTGARPSAPFVLRIDPAGEAAARLAARAGSASADLQAFAGSANAAERVRRRHLARALIAWAADVHPDRVRIGRSALGAPVIETPAGWHLSLSGRGGLCLIGLAREPIGVDIEPEGAEPPPADMLTPDERGRLDALPPQARRAEALVLWLAKEAHAKRIGLARTMEPGEIEIARAEDGLLARSPGHSSRCWLQRAGGAVAAVAL